MKPRLLAALATASVVMLGLTLPAPSPQVSAESDGWLRDYASALKQSKDTGKPILLEFR